MTFSTNIQFKEVSLDALVKSGAYDYSKFRGNGKIIVEKPGITLIGYRIYSEHWIGSIAALLVLLPIKFTFQFFHYVFDNQLFGVLFSFPVMLIVAYFVVFIINMIF